MNTVFLRLACHLLLTALAALVTELLALALLRLLLGPLRVCAVVLGVVLGVGPKSSSIVSGSSSVMGAWNSNEGRNGWPSQPPSTYSNASRTLSDSKWRVTSWMSPSCAALR